MERGIAWHLEYWLETGLLSALEWIAAYPILTFALVLLFAAVVAPGERARRGGE